MEKKIDIKIDFGKLMTSILISLIRWTLSILFTGILIHVMAHVCFLYFENTTLLEELVNMSGGIFDFSKIASLILHSIVLLAYIPRMIIFRENITRTESEKTKEE